MKTGLLVIRQGRGTSGTSVAYKKRRKKLWSRTQKGRTSVASLFDVFKCESVNCLNCSTKKVECEPSHCRMEFSRKSPAG
jgi:hypothetical protein